MSIWTGHIPQQGQIVFKRLWIKLGVGGHNLDLPVLEGERFVLFVVQIELAHSEKQLVGVDAARKVEFLWLLPLVASHSLTSQRSGLQLWPSFHSGGQRRICAGRLLKKMIKNSYLNFVNEYI